MKKITVSILTTLLMLSMVFSSSVFAAEKEQSAWESFLGLFSAKTAATSDVGVEYRGHIQNVGNYPLDGSWIQGPTQLGTVGQSLRLEGFWIQLDGDVPADAHIEYQVHVQNVGWMDPVQDGEFAGTEGRSLQIEAIKISLVDDEGVQLEDYSVVYSGHVQNVGDVGPFTNGEQLGTVGSFLRLEAIEVEIVQNPADLTEYNAALAAVTQADYTAASWTTYQAVVNANKMTEDNLQSEVDAATANIVAAQANLVLIPKVASVTAINAKQIQVVFNKAVDQTTAQTNTNYTIGTFTSTNFVNKLQADGKTVIITLGSGDALTATATNYVVKVSKNVLDTTGAPLPANYEALISMSDTTRPTTTLSYPANGVARVTFSEPMNVANAAAIEAAMTITAPTGEAAVSPTGLVTLDSSNTFFEINTSTFVADKDYTVSLVGLKDYAANLITPNPNALTVRNSKVDTTKPTVTSAVAMGVNKIQITYSEKLSVLGTVNGETIVVGGGGNATVDTTGLIYTVTTSTASPALSGVTVVTIAGFKDLSANTGDNAVRTLNFVADTTKPVYVSSEVKQLGADQYLYIKYSKNVTIGAGAVAALTGTYVDANSVTKAMTTINATDASQVLAYGATTTDTIKVKITGLAAGTYTVATDADLVDDLAATPNSAASATINFTFGSFVDPTIPVPTVASVQATEDKVAINFSVDVTAATALNTANYTVEGQQVFKSAIFNGNTKSVVLTLNPDVITLTGDRVLTIKNVATPAGNVMVDFNSTQNFKENVKPVLVSAAIKDSTHITATFSENVTATGTANFEYYIDGVKQAAVTNATMTNQKTVDITVPTITDLTRKYEVKYVGTDVKDQTTPANTGVTGTIVTVK